MSIEQELRQGTVKFTVQEDGTETIERRPPTARDIRAANEIARLRFLVDSLSRQFNGITKPVEEVKNATNTEDVHEAPGQAGTV